MCSAHAKSGATGTAAGHRRELFVLDVSAQARATEQATNRIAIDGFRCAIDPIERRERVVVRGARIGTVIEKDRDSLHETGFGRVVESGRMPAVVVLTCEAPIVHVGAMTKERGDKFGIVFSALISCAREPDPRSRSIEARSGARKHRREFGVENPTPCTNARRVGAVVEQHCNHRDVLQRRGMADRSRAAEKRFVRL
jgi:hypothetical protein